MRYTPESERFVLLMRNWEWFLPLVMVSRPLVGMPSFCQITLGGGEPCVVTGDGTGVTQVLSGGRPSPTPLSRNLLPGSIARGLARGRDRDYDSYSSHLG